MKRKIFGSLTSASLPLFIQNTSVANGGGLSGLVFNTAGLVAEYRRQGQATWTVITLAAGTLGTYVNSGAAGSGGGFVLDGGLAGAYELMLPDAAIAAGARWVAVRLYGAANMLACLVEMELDLVNYQSSTAFIASVPLVVGNVGGITGVTFPGTVGDATIANQTTVNNNVLAIPSAVTVATAVWVAATRTLTTFGFGVTVTTDSANQVASQTAVTAIKVQTDKVGLNTADSPNTVTAQTTIAGLVAAVWASATRTLTAFGFNVTVGTDSAAQITSQAAVTAIKVKTDLVATNAADSPNAATAQTTIAGLAAAAATAVWTSVTRTLTAFGFGVTVATDSATQIASQTAVTAIKLKTDLVSTNAADSPNVVTSQGIVAGMVAAVWAAATRTLTAFGFTVAANNLPTDYQQRAVVVTLPANVLGVTDHTNIQVDVTTAIAGITATVNAINAALALQGALTGIFQGAKNFIWSGTGANATLTSYDVFQYNSNANTVINDGVTGKVHQFTLSFTYNGSGQEIGQSVSQIS